MWDECIETQTEEIVSGYLDFRKPSGRLRSTEEEEEEEPLFLHLQPYRTAEAVFHWLWGTILHGSPLRLRLEWLIRARKLELIFADL